LVCPVAAEGLGSSPYSRPKYQQAMSEHARHEITPAADLWGPVAFPAERMYTLCMHHVKTGGIASFEPEAIACLQWS
jgi:hypothetical protein